MYFDLNDEQRAFRDSLRAYFAERLTQEVRAALGPRAGEHMGPPFRDFVKQMGHDGWLGVGWPVESVIPDNSNGTAPPKLVIDCTDRAVFQLALKRN